MLPGIESLHIRICRAGEVLKACDSHEAGLSVYDLDLVVLSGNLDGQGLCRV